MPQEIKMQTLEEEVEHILEEARMVLPGLQALFGFQLIAVFNDRFAHDLGDAGKELHLLALVLTAVAVGLIMAPAAYHRQVERDRISKYFASYASLMVTLAMGPLSLALSIEVALVGFLVTNNLMASWLIGCALMAYLASLWFGFPAFRKLLHRASFPARRSNRP